MQISTYDAVRYGFILDRNQEKIDPTEYENQSSFDLTFREILYKNQHDESVERGALNSILVPQDSVYLVSEQYIRVPKGYIAYVFLKNSLSQRGLLALNTGIIDQGYYGPISTLVINLSKESTTIPVPGVRPSAAFFRVVFHKIDSSICEHKAPVFPESSMPIDYDRYIYERMGELHRLPRTFLNQHEIEQRIQTQVEKRIKSIQTSKITLGIGLLALVFAFYPILRDNIVKYYYDIDKYLVISEKNKEKSIALEQELSLLKLELSLFKESNCDTEKQQCCSIPQPTITQNLNITTSDKKDTEAVKKELIDSLFTK